MGVPEARIALCKCSEGGRIFGVRFERHGDGWMATWAFPIKKDGFAEREHYDSTRLTGTISWDPGYPGCPYCGSKGFIVCSCGALSCNDGRRKTFACGWCGLTGELEAYDGSGFDGDSDR